MQVVELRDFIWNCYLVNVKIPANACRRCVRGQQGSVISEVLFQRKDALQSRTLAKASSPGNIWCWGWKQRVILVTLPLTLPDLAPGTFRLQVSFPVFLASPLQKPVVSEQFKIQTHSCVKVNCSVSLGGFAPLCPWAGPISAR